MAVHVAGLWELGWNTPIKEVELWMFPLREYGVDRFFMVPVSGIAEKKVEERPDLGGLIEEERAAGRQIVFVDEGGDQPLQEFEHPAEPTYVLGRTGLTPRIAYGTKDDVSVRIETPSQSGLLWAHQAALIVLHDRMIRWR